MSSIVHGVYQGSVVVEDEDGQGAIPLSLLHRARRLVENREPDTAVVYGRAYHRDTLIAADNAVTDLTLPELPPCHVCVDVAAIDADHKDRPVCFTHIPDDNPSEF